MQVMFVFTWRGASSLRQVPRVDPRESTSVTSQNRHLKRDYGAEVAVCPCLECRQYLRAPEWRERESAGSLLPSVLSVPAKIKETIHQPIHQNLSL